MNKPCQQKVKKRCVAMLLAGGQGSRLHALTASLAKPAVSFGAKYRIIDFTLSNCANSGLDTVGILTQYEPFVLVDYIDNGKPWDLDRSGGGTHILSPYQAKDGEKWYRGTANAVYQNLNFLKKYDSEHVLILSGDHIYNMDYSDMLRAHIRKKADCTISVISVAKEEASRFGILSFDKSNRITQFEEKPAEPKSNNASMGVYVFKKDALVSALIADEKDPLSSNDFGKNIIPKMIAERKALYVYQFNGYWRDVGTLESLWEANMDLLNDKSGIELGMGNGRVLTNNCAFPPCYFGKSCAVSNTIITSGCEIYGTVSGSVVSQNVTVEKDAIVSDSIVLRDADIGKNARLSRAIVDESATVGANTKIGEKDGSLALVGRGCVVASDKNVEPGSVLEAV